MYYRAHIYTRCSIYLLIRTVEVTFSRYRHFRFCQLRPLTIKFLIGEFSLPLNPFCMCSLNYLRSTNNNLSDWKIHGVTCDKRNRGVFFSRIYSYTVHIAVALQRNFSLDYSYIATAHAILTKNLLFTVHEKYTSFEQINNTSVYHASLKSLQIIH